MEETKSVCEHRFAALEERVGAHGRDIEEMREQAARMDALLDQLQKVYYASLTAVVGAVITAIVAVLKMG